MASASSLVPAKRERSPSLELVSYLRTGPPPFDREADFIIRTPQTTRYHVSAGILSFASPFFRDLPRIAPTPAEPFILDVPEQDATLEIILRLTYPIPDPVLHDLDDLCEAYIAAQKYQLDAATAALRKMLLLPRFVEEEPLRVYALACRFGFKEEADVASNFACKSSPQAWPVCDEFEHITGAQYHELMLYHRRRGMAAVQVLQGQELCVECLECGKLWSKKYRKQVARLLLDAPNERPCLLARVRCKVREGPRLHGVFP